MRAGTTAARAGQSSTDDAGAAAHRADGRRFGHQAAGAAPAPSADQGTDAAPPAQSLREVVRLAAAPGAALVPVPAARSGPQADGATGPAVDPSAASAGAGDEEFRCYVQTRRRALLRTAYLLTGNVADAEDLVQSALAKTYLAWDRIADRGALDGYVRRAIVNTHISWWRRRRVEEFPTDELPDRAAADNAVSCELQEALRRAVDRLPQRMRAAILLRYYDDMTEAEVAETLGVSLGTVKSTVARAVAKLRVDAELQPD